MKSQVLYVLGFSIWGFPSGATIHDSLFSSVLRLPAFTADADRLGRAQNGAPIPHR